MMVGRFWSIAKQQVEQLTRISFTKAQNIEQVQSLLGYHGRIENNFRQQ